MDSADHLGGVLGGVALLVLLVLLLVSLLLLVLLLLSLLLDEDSSVELWIFCQSKQKSKGASMAFKTRIWFWVC